MHSLKIKCPHCDYPIWFFRIKKDFDCPHCQRHLTSNAAEADTKIWIGYICASPLIWCIADILFRMINARPATYDEWSAILSLVAVGIYLIITPLLITVSKADRADKK